MSDIAERIRNIVIHHLQVDAKDIDEETRFVEDLGADSIDLVELRLALEEEFDVEIPEEAADSILTIGAAVKFLSARGMR
jgi:acyl carrier protein